MERLKILRERVEGLVGGLILGVLSSLCNGDLHHFTFVMGTLSALLAFQRLCFLWDCNSGDYLIYFIFMSDVINLC